MMPTARTRLDLITARAGQATLEMERSVEMTMNAKMVLTLVTMMLVVKIPKALTTVPVIMDMKEMDITALVSI